jgi:hypothetical protein
MFWMKSTVVILAYVLFLSVTVDSLTLTMKAGPSVASGKTASLLFVTNKMCPFAQKVGG